MATVHVVHAKGVSIELELPGTANTESSRSVEHPRLFLVVGRSYTVLAKVHDHEGNVITLTDVLPHILAVYTLVSFFLILTSYSYINCLHLFAT